MIADAQPLPHLPLRRAIAAGDRRRVARGFSRPRQYDDIRQHAAELDSRVSTLSAVHLQRRAVAGIDPKLVLVFELASPVAADDFRRAELRVLDESSSKSVIAFADDPQLREFRSRLDRYGQGVPEEEGRTGAAFEAFFDTIVAVRPMGPDDRMTDRLVEALGQAEPGLELRLDVELWHPGDGELGRRWLDEVASAVEALGGRLVDTYVNEPAGLILARAYVAPEAVRELAQLDQIARIDLLPTVKLTAADLVDVTPDMLPRFDPPSAEDPIVAVIDSGVASAHPLLAGAVRDAVALARELPTAVDESGHGTRVAGIVLHGDVGPLVGAANAPRPPCQILSIRVLDADSCFPQEQLWEKHLEEALRYAASQGAQIAVLAVGDPRTPYVGPRAAPVSGVIDQLARELRMVVVVPVGNVWPGFYAPQEASSIDQYPVHLLADPHSAILDPAPSAIALTVGGLCPEGSAGGAGSREVVDRRPLGTAGWPSPLSRHGPGVRDAIKPELAAVAGSVAFDLGVGAFVEDTELKIAGGSVGLPGRLIEADLGTSYAAPVVARTAAAALQRYPKSGANLIRALVLQAISPARFAADLVSDSPAERREAVLNLLGYGEARHSEAFESSTHRAVLTAEGEIPVDGVHIYEVPLPASFFESGGRRSLVVALSFDPETRVRRLDYLSTRMDFHLLRGTTVDRAQEFFLATPEEDIESIEESADDEDESESVESAGAVSRFLLKMEPPARARSRGSNQVGRKGFGQKLSRERYGESLLLVVRNTNYWATPGTLQPYALAVALGRDPDHSEVYADLQARVAVPIQVEIRPPA